MTIFFSPGQWIGNEQLFKVGPIALNVLNVKKEKIYLAYVSKYNSNREKQVILSIIWNGEKWHYLAIKKLSALLRGITSEH